ncbi:hypothetical protein JKP88DRAFT_11261 [Tribonema minus]|uniref:Uncharacterized protein n=1 Tax=Tribonema minus TaxID=303371 RepID=A0A835ZLQ1_9STRA|nr:hypothetical protein JKP88DRAFT_11261 [Tribonema minus]
MRLTTSLAALAGVCTATHAFVPCPHSAACGGSSKRSLARTQGAARPRTCTRMSEDAAAANNIIPKMEEGDSGIKMQVLSRPTPPPDRISHQSFSDALQESEALRKAQLPPAYTATATHGSAPASLDEESLKRRLMVAKTFARMAPLILLMRGENIIADDFMYFSPCTGTLNKEEFLGLLRTTDRAFPSMASFPQSFTVYKDGLVSYRTAYRTSFDGPLTIGDKELAPNGVTAISDVELCTVSFDEAGLMRSYACGVVVDKADEYKDPAVMDRIEALQTKVAGNKIKVESLAGQEHTIAYQKSMEEINHLETELTFLLEQVDVEANTGGLGGIAGLFFAVGLEWPDVHSLLGKAPHKRVGGTMQGGISVPSEVTYPVVVWN